MEDMKFTYKVSELKPHPMNAELFDDIDDGKWDEFLESIKENGVIEPLIVTQDKVIVSGHQRVRACKELGIDEVECIVKYYDDADDVLRELIETNIRQRGDIGGSFKKTIARIDELQRIKGVRKGSYGSPKSDSEATQEDVLKEFGISKDTYSNYKKLANAIPELYEAVETGAVTQGAALAMMKQLSEEEQEELISQLDVTKKYTQKEIDEKLAEYKKPEVQVVEKEPADYKKNKAELEKANKKIAGLEDENRIAKNDLKKRTEERNKYRDQVKTFEAADARSKKSKHQIETAGMFNARVNKFIEEVAGYVWLTDEINELPDSDRLSFMKSVQKIKDWATQMEYNIKNNQEVIE